MLHRYFAHAELIVGSLVVLDIYKMFIFFQHIRWNSPAPALFSCLFQPSNAHFGSCFEIPKVWLDVKDRGSIKDVQVHDRQLVFVNG